jgi:hypothetical protein
MGFPPIPPTLANAMGAVQDKARDFANGKKDASSEAEKFRIVGQDWYKVFGYQFVILANGKDSEPGKSNNSAIDKIKGAAKTLANLFTGQKNADGPSEDTAETKYYTLPIPPQSLMIKPLIASQATPTLGGVVEETSDNVLWMISMQGTTGIAPSRAMNGDTIDRRSVAKQFRDTISTTGLLAGITGQLNKTISKIGGALDSALSAAESFKEGNIAGGIGNAVDIAGAVTMPSIPYSGSAVSEKSNGFTEIQELSKFIDMYNSLKHKNPKKYKLVFRMFKTNQQWNCIIQDFSIQKSAQSPHLWRYNLVLKCWSLQTVSAQMSKDAEFNRFAAGGDLKSVNTIGLGALSLMGKMGFNKKGK